jgi:hypothetical protein
MVGPATRNRNFGHTIRENQTQIFWKALESFVTGCISHESWKPRWVNGELFFPTAEEAAYPAILCQRLASICLDEAKRRGLSPCQSLQQQLLGDPSVGKSLFAAQSRGKKLKQVAEYGREFMAVVPVGYQSTENLLQQFPKGTNIIHRQLHWGFARDEWRNSSSWLAPIDEGAHFKVLTLGILREPEDFIKDASEMGTSKACVCKSSHLDEGSSGGSFSFRPLQDRASKYRQCTQAVLRIFLACVQL